MEIEEQDLALLLLTSLSRSYDCLVTILLVGKETLKLEEVTIVLYRSRCSLRINNFDYGAFMVKSYSSHGSSMSWGKNYREKQISNSRLKNDINDVEYYYYYEMGQY